MPQGKMSSPSASPRVDETLCPSCRHNIPVGIKIAGQHVTRMQCWHHSVPIDPRCLGNAMMRG